MVTVTCSYVPKIRFSNEVIQLFPLCSAGQGLQSFGRQTIWATDVWVTRRLGDKTFRRQTFGRHVGRQDVWETTFGRHKLKNFSAIFSHPCVVAHAGQRNFIPHLCRVQTRHIIISHTYIHPSASICYASVRRMHCTEYIPWQAMTATNRTEITNA